MTPTILAIDASSVMLGWCVYNGRVRDYGEIALSGADIADRCRQAHAALEHLLRTNRTIDVIAIESPVARFAKAVIPQARVSGALMACAGLMDVLVVEVTPQHAKHALCGRGNAKKDEMQVVARGMHGVEGEHAADALGVALAAVKVVTVERQAV